MEPATVLMAVIGVWLGSVEVRLRQATDKADKKVSMEEVDERIILRQEASKEALESLKRDMLRLQDKLDDIDIIVREIYTRGK